MNKNLKYILKTSAIILVVPAFFTSCKKLVEIDAPQSSVSQLNVYASDETAISVLTGIYTSMSTNGSVFTGNQGLSLRVGLSADELQLSSKVTDVKMMSYYKNALTVKTSPGAGFESWEPLYKLIFYANSALDGLNGSTSLSEGVKKQLIGEAKFVRALCYFYLVNNFGDVPLATTIDYKINTALFRSSQQKVYELIIADLKDAQSLLSSDYLDGNLRPYSGTEERVRPTKWAATALLARVYLYTGDYASSELQCTEVINETGRFSLATLNDVFLMNSTEAIWQLQPTNSGWNTEDARYFVINRAQGNSKPVYLSKWLLNSFEPGDARITSWVKDTTIGSTKYFYPFKYKKAVLDQPVTEYFMMLRLGELYMIRAEARANLGKIDPGKEDLNAIRTRAGLPNTAATDQASLLTAIMQERRIELFTELGSRWYDLKRTGALDAVMNIITPLKGGTWEATRKLFPLPLTEIERNTNLSQNLGY